MDYPYPTSFLMPLPGKPVEFIVKRIATMPNETTIEKKGNETDQEKLNIRRIISGAEVYYNFTGEAKCLDLENQDDIGADMWDYQACTEMVMPFCFKGENGKGSKDMFEPKEWNKTAVAEECKKKWKVTPRFRMADIMYGSKKLEAASNIVFSNGLRDPWSSGGVTKNIGDLVTVLIPEGAHHLDLRASNPLDPKSVIDARNIHKENIRKWINKASIKTSNSLSSNAIPVAIVKQEEERRVKIEVLP